MLKEVHMAVCLHLSVVGTISLCMFVTIGPFTTFFEVNVNVKLFVVKFNIFDKPWGVDSERLGEYILHFRCLFEYEIMGIF
jgi:hypothetical protein